MEFSVTFRHMEPSDALKEYAVEKLSRLEKYFDAIIEAQVVLSVEKFRHIADVTVNCDGVKIKGQEQTEDMYSAIDMVMDKMERQAKRYRERFRERKSSKRDTIRSTGSPVAGSAGEEIETGPKVFRTQQNFSKPMDLDEALMQIELSGERFLVYTDAETQQLNVLYARPDGHFELIEPLKE
jgi:putative sigma-54 modulation protein